MFRFDFLVALPLYASDVSLLVTLDPPREKFDIEIVVTMGVDIFLASVLCLVALIATLEHRN